ncbi:MAG: hypothetical protein Kow0010_14700 [Dehalococcoidia bacterium]
MDNDFSVDIDEIAATLQTSDVVTIRFVTVGERLLLDFRATEVEGPLVRVVEPVRTAGERYASLKRLRPRFAVPERIVAVWWPRFVPSLRSTGVWEGVRMRIAEAERPECLEEAEAALRELMALERANVRNAVLGFGFRTMWQRARV